MPEVEQHRGFVAARLASIILDAIEGQDSDRGERNDALVILTRAGVEKLKLREYERGYRAGAEIMTMPLD